MILPSSHDAWTYTAIQAARPPATTETREKIAFFMHSPDLISHFRNICAALDPTQFEIVACASEPATNEILYNFASERGYAVVYVGEAFERGFRYPVAVSNQHGVAGKRGDAMVLSILAEHQIRLMYALGKSAWNFDDWNTFYHIVLCFGPFDQSGLARYRGVRKVAVGYPRFDRFFNEPIDRDQFVSAHGGDPARANVIWLPTWGKMSSIDCFSGAVAELARHYNVFVKLHYGTASREPERYARICDVGFTRVMDSAFDNVCLYQIADFVLADYGGSPFGAIYTDRNVILLDVPGAADEAYAGIDSADVALRSELPHLGPEQSSRFEELLANADLWNRQKQVRAKLRAAYFAPYPGFAAKVAAEAIRNWRRIIALPFEYG